MRVASLFPSEIRDWKIVSKMVQSERVGYLASLLYGSERGAEFARRLEALIAEYNQRVRGRPARIFTQADAMLIVYPDQVLDSDRSPLSSLVEFSERHVQGIFSVIHVLPFYPWSSDDGFSVIDFRSVASRYGTWDDVRRLGRHFGLMLDAEVNHASIQSDWFHLFAQGRIPYRDYFIRFEGGSDLSRVVRPRTTALATHVWQGDRRIAVWTTFGPDQVDLNYRSPDLLLEMLDVLLFYAIQGADLIRLDAVAYLWKEPGTSCVNLPQTHLVVQMFRAVLDQVAPHVGLVTETNVPQDENVSYFGNGRDEAQLVYNFPLPPLVLHAFHKENAAALSGWITSCALPSNQVAFLNMLATHDGIGLNPLSGILTDGEIRELVQVCVAHGGLVSYKENTDGSSSPYELNMNFFDALEAVAPQVDPALQVQRFITAHAIVLSLRGVPAIYFHSLFGSRGWREGVLLTGRNRSINREKLGRERLESELADPTSRRAQVFQRLRRLLAVRSRLEAFSPESEQRIVSSQGPVLALLRGTLGQRPHVLCLHNLSKEQSEFRTPDPGLIARLESTPPDLITNAVVELAGNGCFHLGPYQTLWLALDSQES